jgi:hypothetical protein
MKNILSNQLANELKAISESLESKLETLYNSATSEDQVILSRLATQLTNTLHTARTQIRFK